MGKWCRPNSATFPTVWKKFTRKDKNGQEHHFQIEDIPEDLYEQCIEFMTKYFLPNEPFYACLGFMNDDESIKEQQKWWRDILPEKLSLVCLMETPEGNQIAGINFMYYHHKRDDSAEVQLKGEKLKTVCEIVNHIEAQTDRYALLQVEDYIDEFGLCVRTDLQGMGIATELLQARDNLAKAVGLKATFTIFTAIASQKAADRAGFVNLVEIKYTDLMKKFSSYVLDVKDTPSIRYMYKNFTT